MINDIGKAGWINDGSIFLIITRRLPSLNDYINKNRSNPYAGASFKKEIDDAIKYDILLSAHKGYLRQIKQTEYPVQIEILWREENAKRDVDNIKSAAKYILDALVEMHILKNDGQKYVSQVYDEVAVDPNRPSGVYVKIIPKGKKE
jgi:Holliday junction resolvase RusA-like endonuclease